MLKEMANIDANTWSQEDIKKHPETVKKFSETDIINVLQFLIDNIYAMFVGRAFQQIVGIPIGTNCVPRLTDFIQGLLK